MTGTLLWLVALAALSLAAAVGLRRMGRLAGGTRELQQLQADIAGVERRLSTVVDPLVGRLDDVRRGARDPADLAPELDAARTALRSLAKEARTLKPPAALTARIEELRWELERAVRAADMAGHGIALLAASRHGRGPSSDEAQVAVKRGALGLRHAREAVRRAVAGIAVLTPVEVRLMPASGHRTAGGSIPTPGLDEDLLVGGEDQPSA